MAHEEERFLVNLDLLANGVRDRRPSQEGFSVPPIVVTRRERAGRLPELAAKSKIRAVDLSELFRSRIYVLEIPFKLIFKFVRADNDIQLRGVRVWGWRDADQRVIPARRTKNVP